MDRLVQLFSGGLVKENGEFEKMRQQIARFDRPPSFEEVFVRVRSMFRVGKEESELLIRGRFDAGDKRAHYMLMSIDTEDDWMFYKELVKGSQVGCLELVVDVRDSVTAQTSDRVADYENEDDDYDVDMSNGSDSEDEFPEANRYDSCRENNDFDVGAFYEDWQDEDGISEGSEEEEEEEMMEGVT